MALDQQLINNLRESNPWLAPFNLSDEDFYNVTLYVSRVLLGSDGLEDFIPNLKDSLPDLDFEIIEKMALEAAKENFWNMREDIGDVEGFIKKLGGTLPEQEEDGAVSEKQISEKTPKDYLIKTEIPSPQINIPNNSSKSMTFSTKDEEEVKKIEVPPAEAYKLDYDTLADDIISKFGYNEDDGVLHKRLSNIIISRFRDVRDEMESVDALTKSQKVGGMEFSKEQAEGLLKLIKAEQEAFKQYHISSTEPVQRIEFAVRKPEIRRPEVRVKTLEEKRDGEMGKIQPVSVPLLTKEGQGEVMKVVKEENVLIEKKKTQEEIGSIPTMDEEDGLPVLRMPEDLMVKPKMVEVGENFPLLSKEGQGEVLKVGNQSPTSVFNNVSKPLPASPLKGEEPDQPNDFVENKSIPESPVPIVSKVEKSTPLPRPAPYVTASSIPPRVMESQNTRRPIVDGIKLAKKLTGPIEELSGMTIIDFRRLASTPAEAINDVRKKIQLLQEESYNRRAEGVEAWFESEVNKFYRLLGQTSMTEGKSIDDIIKERLLSGKPTLSLEEFNAVMQLNSELRY